MAHISTAELAREEKKRRENRPKRISVEAAKNGGFIVEHNEDMYPNPKHAFNDGKAMLAHVKEHMCKGEK
jgi:hypothetical protein